MHNLPLDTLSTGSLGFIKTVLFKDIGNDYISVTTSSTMWWNCIVALIYIPASNAYK